MSILCVRIRIDRRSTVYSCFYCSSYFITSFWVYVKDCDFLFNRAVEAGCEVLMPMEDAFWGDRFGKVKDPFGHCWAIASFKWILTPEEIEERQKEMAEL